MATGRFARSNLARLAHGSAHRSRGRPRHQGLSFLRLADELGRDVPGREPADAAVIRRADGSRGGRVFVGDYTDLERACEGSAGAAGEVSVRETSGGGPVKPLVGARSP